MPDSEFEWDDAKAARNWRDHGVSFEEARDAFDDPHSVGRVGRRHDDREERLALIGMARQSMLFVSFTLRGERVRIICARKVEPHERRRYHTENRAP